MNAFALARSRPSLVLVISSRSNSARPPRTVSISRQCGASTCGSFYRCFHFSTPNAACNKSISLMWARYGAGRLGFAALPQSRRASTSLSKHR
jgi:hypothetical protein